MDLRPMDRPPCWKPGAPCPNRCAAAHYWRTIFNHTELHGPWSGWRLAGARLVSPSRDWASPAMVDRWMYSHWRLYGPKSISPSHTADDGAIDS
jgi:hypothetical protein